MKITRAVTAITASIATLISENIKAGITILGTAGKTEVVDTTTAVGIAAGEMKTGKEAFVNGAKVTGTGTKTLDPASDVLAAGYYAATTLAAVDMDLIIADIKTGVNIFGKVGTYDTEAGNPITAGDVIAPHVGFVNGAKVTGTVTEKVGAAVVLTPSTIDQAIPEGRYGGVVGDGKVLGDADLVAGKIKAGVNIFGVAGTYETPLTGDAGVNDVKAGLLFYKDDATTQLTGALATVALDPDLDAYPAGYHAGAASLHAIDADLVTGNIRATKTIFGVAGKTEVVDTTSGDAIAGDILLNKKAWVDGIEITGSVPAGANCNGADKSLAVTITDGLYSGSKTATAADALLVSGNVKTGVSIFGVAGDFTAGGTVKATGTITTSGDGAEAGNTVLIDAKTYTFVTPIGITEGNVLVDGTPAERLDNLMNAINKGAGGGIVYVCAAAHPTVEATTNTDTVQTLQALTAGHAGNVTLTITADHLAASDTTLKGGLSAAAAGDIKAGHFAWVNGVKLEGTLP